MINHLESITVRLLCKTPAAGDDKPAYQLRRYHQSPLTPHVIPYQNRMKLSPRRFIKDPVGFQIKFQYFFIYRFIQLRRRYHIHQCRLHSKGRAGILKMGRPENPQHRFAFRRHFHSSPAFCGINISRRIRPVKHQIFHILRIMKTSRRRQSPVHGIHFPVFIPVKRGINGMGRFRFIRHLHSIKIIPYRHFQLMDILYSIIGK